MFPHSFKIFAMKRSREFQKRCLTRHPFFSDTNLLQLYERIEKKNILTDSWQILNGKKIEDNYLIICF